MGFGSVAGGISNSGLRIKPRTEEDAPFNPPTLASLRKFEFQSPIPPMGERQYTPPRIMPGLERAAPRPDFSPQPGGDATGAMPPIEQPGARLPLPVYQEPEPPGKLRTALGIGLSGVAGLSGQSQYAAQNFFLAPEARAERDYARELGAYSARQGEWSQYYEDIMNQQNLELNRAQLEELRTRPRSFSRGGGLVGRGGEELYRDPSTSMFGGGAQWEATKMQAYNVWLEKNPGKTLATMTATDRQEAERDLNRYFGREVLTPVWDPDRPGVITGEYRSDAPGKPQPVTVYGPQGAQTGGQPGFQRQQPPQPRQRGFTDAQEANTRLEYEEERTMAVSLDEESRLAVEDKYDAIFVRNQYHLEGDKMTKALGQEYLRIARKEVGDAATNAQVERQALQWAREDGYDMSGWADE